MLDPASPCTRPLGYCYPPAFARWTTASRGSARAGHSFCRCAGAAWVALLARGLPGVKADPSDLQARLDCQMGTWLSMGPLAGGVPMGASHGIGYVIGALFDIPHGHTSCVMLPAVMRWNKSANAERQALVAAAMDHPGEDAADVLDAFIAGLGMPRSLGAVNVGRSLRAHGGTGDGHTLGAAQSAPHRRTGAGPGDFGARGLAIRCAHCRASHIGAPGIKRRRRHPPAIFWQGSARRRVRRFPVSCSGQRCCSRPVRRGSREQRRFARCPIPRVEMRPVPNKETRIADVLTVRADIVRVSLKSDAQNAAADAACSLSREHGQAARRKSPLLTQSFSTAA